MITNLDRLIRLETQKAIKSILESSLTNGNEDERRRQKSQEDAVDKRSLKANDETKSSKDEADDSEDKEKPEDKKREDRTKGKGTADSPKLDAPKKKQLEDPTVKSVVDKLNALRGGMSLNDPDVRKSFEQYFDSLTLPERQSLLLFMTGIAQILSGKSAGAEAVDPSDVGLRVKDTDQAKLKTQKKEEKPESGKKGTEENPIIVGEVASKKRIMQILKKYRENS